MKFYDRYISGEREQVYNEIYALGESAFLPDYFFEIDKLLNETFRRVAYNLDIIYYELKKSNYLFRTEFKSNFERPLIKPQPDTEELLSKLEKTVSPYGFLPLSLKKFYRIVGACNFGWDYGTNEEYLWQFADPIQVYSLDDVVSEITDEDYLSDLKEYYNEDGFISIPLSGDYLHKDNTSGGSPYSLKVTEKQSIDSVFLNEENETTFINYLRICFDNCGFSRITNLENNNSYQQFFERIKSRLKPI